MQTIHFSHKYIKTRNTVNGFKDTAILLEIFLTTKAELSPDFIIYDTTIITGEQYSLPTGKLIVLLLQSYGEVWTTCRRWTAEKEAYYRALRGQQVRIKVKGQT